MLLSAAVYRSVGFTLLVFASATLSEAAAPQRLQARDPHILEKRIPQFAPPPPPPPVSIPRQPPMSSPTFLPPPTDQPSLPPPLSMPTAVPSPSLPPVSLPSLSPPPSLLPSLPPLSSHPSLLPSIPLPSGPPQLPSPPPLKSILPSPPPLPSLGNFTSMNDTTNVSAIVGGVVGGVLGLGVIIASVLLWWYLKGRKRGNDGLGSVASSREDLSRIGTGLVTPYNLDQPDELHVDAEKTAVSTPNGPSTSQLDPQQQFYDQRDPYSLVPSPPPVVHAQYAKPFERYDQPRYMGVAETY